MVSGAGRLLLSPEPGKCHRTYDKCLNKYWDYVEKQRSNIKTYPWAFLVSTYFHSPKKNRGTRPHLPSYIEIPENKHNMKPAIYNMRMEFLHKILI
jgi:hypothetical protein